MSFAAADVARAEDADPPSDFAERFESVTLSDPEDALAQSTEVLPPLSEPLRSSSGSGEVIAYGGADAWQHGGSLYLGGEWSPFGSGGTSPVIRLFAADGIDDFKTRFTTYRSETVRASVLPGLRLQAGTFDLKLFAGADYEMRIALRPAFEKPVQFFGARIAADVWWEPADGWMVSGSASATTIESGLSARIASGWRLPFAWVGPEVLAFHDIFNTQYRAGAHLTGLKFGFAEWSVAGGYSRDSFGRNSPYGRIGFTLRP